MLGSISATDGHACMLRAMCEASAAPLHSDGLLGDALNLLLSAGHALVPGAESEEDIGSYREYSEAQTEGMVRKTNVYVIQNRHIFQYLKADFAFCKLLSIFRFQETVHHMANSVLFRSLISYPTESIPYEESTKTLFSTTNKAIPQTKGGAFSSI